jgi:hypothetical protein
MGVVEDWLPIPEADRHQKGSMSPSLIVDIFNKRLSHNTAFQHFNAVNIDPTFHLLVSISVSVVRVDF